jgi:hypothetical protein
MNLQLCGEFINYIEEPRYMEPQTPTESTSDNKNYRGVHQATLPAVANIMTRPRISRRNIPSADSQRNQRNEQEL